jgi:hypothetical protein
VLPNKATRLSAIELPKPRAVPVAPLCKGPWIAACSNLLLPPASSRPRGSARSKYPLGRFVTFRKPTGTVNGVDGHVRHVGKLRALNPGGVSLVQLWGVDFS